jgi:L-ascorbate metabolism protein UlaG (beta-lactamase superfamily)
MKDTMKPILTIIFALLFLIRSGDALSQKTVNVCYVANEGFLVELNGKKILFDGIFGGFDGDWCDIPSSETKTKLENSEPPFDNIDLIFISHYHIDHFNSDMIVKHALSDSKCKIICPVQAEKKLSSNEKYQEINNKIIAYTPDFNKDTLLIIEGLKIKIYRLEHGPYFEKDSITGQQINRHQNVENLGFLLEIDGVRIFHCGDLNPWDVSKFENYNFQKENIDIAFLTRSFLTNQEGKGIDIINEYIKPQKIVFMHIDPKYRETYKNIINQISDVLDSQIFDKMMECKEIMIK